MKNVVEVIDGFIDRRLNELPDNRVQLVKATGEVLEEDRSYIEVLIGEQKLYAKPCMPFGWYAVPSREWWAENKDKWGVWVTFEMGNLAHPIWLGMCPLDDTIPENRNYPNVFEFKSRKWSMTFDDQEDSVVIESKAGGEKIKLTVQEISLGRGTEPVLLGNQSTQFLSQLINKLTTAVITTPSGPGAFDPGTIAALNAMLGQLETLKSKTVKTE